MKYFYLNRPSSTRFLSVRCSDAEDIDLVAGALAEKPSRGAVFGPTLSCLLAIQFTSLRNSDRFWYENDLPPSSLSLPQLQAVRRVSLAGLMCEAKGVSRSQPKAFLREDPYLNARLSCDQVRGLELDAWKTNDETVVESSIQDTTQMPEIGELSPEMIETALARAKEELIARKKFEYDAWLRCK